MNMQLILASASPRRRELLGYLGIPFEIRTTDAEEEPHLPDADLLADLPPLDLPLHDHPTLRAWRKADAIAATALNHLVLGVDTIVVLDGHVLNKPTDADDACRMLRQLSGRTHTVYTGLTLIDTRAEVCYLLRLVASQVTIALVSDAAIAEYVATGEPLDKAGAYGIQGLGGKLVEQVEGSYTSVVGLPLVTVVEMLRHVGLPCPIEAHQAYANWLQQTGKDAMPCPPTLP